MTRRGVAVIAVLALAGGAAGVTALVWRGDLPGHAAVARTATPPAVHAPHGTPPGWIFSWPKGDPARGREAFVKFECWSCHEVAGESLPAPKGGDAVGPELASMGPLHEPAFFAEAIVNPNAVIDAGYAAPDGTSKMPSFSDAMTVQEAIDLVAYLAALRPPAGAPTSGHTPPRPESGGRGGHKH